MPNKEVIRLRVIRLIKERAPVTRRSLERAFAPSTREIAKQVIADLIGDNWAAVTGTGRRGSPEKIALSGGWPADRCPLCGGIVCSNGLARK